MGTSAEGLVASIETSKKPLHFTPPAAAAAAAKNLF